MSVSRSSVLTTTFSPSMDRVTPPEMSKVSRAVSVKSLTVIVSEPSPNSTNRPSILPKANSSPFTVMATSLLAGATSTRTVSSSWVSTILLSPSVKLDDMTKVFAMKLSEPAPPSIRASTPSPVIHSNMSLPSPPSSESLPAPPEIWSFPASPKIWSAASPPLMISSPAPPKIISIPAAPNRLSAP